MALPCGAVIVALNRPWRVLSPTSTKYGYRRVGTSGGHMLTALERFEGKYIPSNGCWDWAGACNEHGYGRFRLNGDTMNAHRAAYLLYVGPIPPGNGYHVDHLCRNRRCVRLSHLEVVTSWENALRGVGPAARNSVKTHCKRGHPLDLLNTYFYAPDRSRRCRRCGKVSNRRATKWYRERQKAKGANKHGY